MPKSIITNSYHNPEIMCFRVNGSAAGSAVLTGPDASLAALAVNGTGDYTITLTETATKILYCFQPLSETADKQLAIGTNTTRAIQVLSRTITTSPGASDADFSIMVLVNRSDANYRAAGGGL